jgi:hypothetical protein
VHARVRFAAEAVAELKKLICGEQRREGAPMLVEELGISRQRLVDDGDERDPERLLELVEISRACAGPLPPPAPAAASRVSLA